MNRRLLIVVVAALCAAMSSCQRRVAQGPPEIRLGRDECAECGMMIADDRFAGALLVDGAGERRALVFDDIGCMLDYERRHAPEVAVTGRFVRDGATRAWVGAEGATYLCADRDRLATPMGSGIAAFGDARGASERRGQVGGTTVDWAALGARRRGAHTEGVDTAHAETGG
jgi:copper chaperone NosL